MIELQSEDYPQLREKYLGQKFVN